MSIFNKMQGSYILKKNKMPFLSGPEVSLGMSR